MDNIAHIRIIIFGSLLLLCGAVFFSVTFSLFSDSATSQNNIFAAAETFPTATPSTTPTPTVTPTPTPGIATTLVINEFVWDTTCGNNDAQDAADYWIELYNGSADVVDLQSWRFRNASGGIIQISNSNTAVNPGQYVVISKSGSAFTGNPPCFTIQGTPVTPNLGGSADFLPATTGGAIRLEKPVSLGVFETVDRVEYGPTLNSGILNAPKDQSIARNPNGFDSALGDTFSTSDFVIDTSVSPGVGN